MPKLLAAQRSEEWFAARAGKITASLAGAILGVDPHRGPLAAYNEIQGLSMDNPSKHKDWGVKHEAQALGEYEAQTGNLVFPSGFWMHDRFPWLGASPDGEVDDIGLVEVKCPGHKPEAIPPHHAIQMRVQLACTGRQWCDYFCLAGDGTFLARIERDEWREAALIAYLEKWYGRHIRLTVPPPRRRPTLEVAALECPDTLLRDLLSALEATCPTTPTPSPAGTATERATA